MHLFHVFGILQILYNSMPTQIEIEKKCISLPSTAYRLKNSDQGPIQSLYDLINALPTA